MVYLVVVYLVDHTSECPWGSLGVRARPGSEGFLPSGGGPGPRAGSHRQTGSNPKQRFVPVSVTWSSPENRKSAEHPRGAQNDTWSLTVTCRLYRRRLFDYRNPETSRFDWRPTLTSWRRAPKMVCDRMSRGDEKLNPTSLRWWETRPDSDRVFFISVRTLVPKMRDRWSKWADEQHICAPVNSRSLEDEV